MWQCNKNGQNKYTKNSISIKEGDPRDDPAQAQDGWFCDEIFFKCE